MSRRRRKASAVLEHDVFLVVAVVGITPRAAKEAALFCALAVGLSWTWWGIVFGVAAYAAGGVGSVDRASVAGPLVAVGMAGPLVAALIMRLFVSREGLKGSIGAARGLALYAGAVGLPFALVGAALALAATFGWAGVAWDGSRAAELLTLLPIVLPLAALTALLEEYGWRGYLLPRLLPRGAARASFVTGLVWGLWHLPLLVAGLTFPGVSTLPAVAIFVSAAVMLSFAFTSFHLASGGSVVVAAVLHGSLNASTEVTARFASADAAWLVGPFGVVVALLVLAGWSAALILPGSVARGRTRKS